MSKWRVGLIGCGRIGRGAHLPAYRKYGVAVTALCDLDEERVRAAAEEAGLGRARIFTDPLEFARCADVDLIDVATPPTGRLTLLRNLLAERKPLLIQKPVSYSAAEIAAFATEARGAGVPVAVNHNARWAPVHVRLGQLIRSGELGAPFAITHVNRFNEDHKAWYTNHPEYLFLDHGLHYLDLVRWHTGLEPSEISALARRAPRQTAACPLLYTLHLRFGVNDAPLVTLVFNNAVPDAAAYSCDWFVDGEHGSAHVTLDTVAFIGGGKGKLVERPEGGWVPDGFYGAYRALVDAIDSKGSIPHSLCDHAKTVRLAEAAAASASADGAWVPICQEPTS